MRRPEQRPPGRQYYGSDTVVPMVDLVVATEGGSCEASTAEGTGLVTSTGSHRRIRDAVGMVRRFARPEVLGILARASTGQCVELDAS